MRLHSLLLSAALGLLALATPALAQDNVVAPAPPPATSSNSTVGSPLLRDFDLGGTRTTPPAEQQATQPAQSRPTQPVVVTPQPSESRAQPAPRTTLPPGTAPNMADYLAPRPEAPLPIPEATTEVGVEQALAEPQPQTLPEPAAPSQPVAQPAAWPAYYWAAPALLVLLVGFFLFRRSRKTVVVGAEAPLARAAAPEPVRPAQAPVPAPADDDLRPWLELEFKPEKMVATASEATVHFDLTVKNVGKSAARNVRIQARMFNPSNSQQQDIKAFFATAMASGAPMNVPPQLAAKFKSSVVMPRDKVREIEVQGRPLFIPTVAINILYEYGDGRIGQTSKSYVIGTEKQAAEKMGPFRLDLGPRIYRQVGGRPLDLARAV